MQIFKRSSRDKPPQINSFNFNDPIYTQRNGLYNDGTLPALEPQTSTPNPSELRGLRPSVRDTPTTNTGIKTGSQIHFEDLFKRVTGNSNQLGVENIMCAPGVQLRQNNQPEEEMDPAKNVALFATCKNPYQVIDNSNKISFSKRAPTIQVNLSNGGNLPEKLTNLNNVTVFFGDAHSNILKILIELLMTILKMDSKDFKEFCRQIIFLNRNRENPLSSEQANNLVKQYLIEDKISIDKERLENIKNFHLILGGDEIYDRNPFSVAIVSLLYGVVQLLQKADLPNIKLTIMVSNHGMIVFNDYAVKASNNTRERALYADIRQDQCIIDPLLNDKDIREDFMKNLFYLHNKHYSLLEYDLDRNLYTHGLPDIKVLHKLVNYLLIQPGHYLSDGAFLNFLKNATQLEFKELITLINNAYHDLLNNGEIYNLDMDHPVLQMVWQREGDIQDNNYLTEIAPHLITNVIHGHSKGSEISHREGYSSMDNGNGKSKIFPGESDSPWLELVAKISNQVYEEIPVIQEETLPTQKGSKISPKHTNHNQAMFAASDMEIGHEQFQPCESGTQQQLQPYASESQQLLMQQKMPKQQRDNLPSAPAKKILGEPPVFGTAQNPNGLGLIQPNSISVMNKLPSKPFQPAKGQLAKLPVGALENKTDNEFSLEDLNYFTAQCNSVYALLANLYNYKYKSESLFVQNSNMINNITNLLATLTNLLPKQDKDKLELTKKDEDISPDFLLSHFALTNGATAKEEEKLFNLALSFSVHSAYRLNAFTIDINTITNDARWVVVMKGTFVTVKNFISYLCFLANRDQLTYICEKIAPSTCNDFINKLQELDHSTLPTTTWEDFCKFLIPEANARDQQNNIAANFAMVLDCIIKDLIVSPLSNSLQMQANGSARENLSQKSQNDIFKVQFYYNHLKTTPHLVNIEEIICFLRSIGIFLIEKYNYKDENRDGVLLLFKGELSIFVDGVKIYSNGSYKPLKQLARMNEEEQVQQQTNKVSVYAVHATVPNRI